MSQPNDSWLERYRELLRIYARRLCLNPRLKRLFDSSDLVQETYERAVKGLAGFKGTTEAERETWLRVILERVFYDKLDKYKKELGHIHVTKMQQESSSRLGILLEANQTSPSQQAERNEEELRLAKAIDQLPEDQQDAFVSHKNGLKVAEIAQNLGRTEKAVAGLLFRAKKRLRDLLG